MATTTDAPPIRLLFDPIYAAYIESIGGVAPDIPFNIADDPALWDALPDDLGGQYDAAITLSDAQTLRAADVEIAWALTLHPTLAPLDEAPIRALIHDALMPNADPNALRVALANAGYPDGLALIAVNAAPPPLSETPIIAFNALGIDLRIERRSQSDADAQIAAGRAHIAIIARPTARLPADAIRYASRNIRYRAASGIALSFTPDGLPIVSRT